MQETKELTEELLDHRIDDWVGLMADERVELNKKLTQMLTLIAGFENSIAPQQQGGDGAARSSADLLMCKKLKLHNQAEAAKTPPGRLATRRRLLLLLRMKLP